MTALSDLVDDLHTYWPSLVAPDQSAFWAHEVLPLLVRRESCVIYAQDVHLCVIYAHDVHLCVIYE